MSDGAEASENSLDAVVHSPQWAFTKIPFKTSLLAGQSHEIEDISVRMFNSALVYSGLEFSGTSQVITPLFKCVVKSVAQSISYTDEISILPLTNVCI